MFLRILNTIISLISRNKAGSEDAPYLVSRITQMLIAYITGIVLVFLSNYLLIKIAGVDVYGSYVYIFNLINLLLAFCIPGTDTLLTKMNAIYYGNKEYEKIRGLLFFSIIVTLAGTAIVSLFAKEIAGADVIEKSGIGNWYAFFFFALLLSSFTQIGASSLQGFSKTVLSTIPERIIKPAVHILILFFILVSNYSVSLNRLIYINIFASFIALFVTFIIFFKFKNTFYKGHSVKKELRYWSVSALAFWILSIMNIVNSRVDILLLGKFTESNEQIGVYNIAIRISEITDSLLMLITFVISPLIARLFSQGERGRLQSLVSLSSKLLLVLGLPAAILMILLSKYIMSFFGVNILNGSYALMILAAGQIISLLCGVAGYLLIMTGNQKYSILSLVAAIILKITLNLVLTPHQGLLGTAIASAASLILWKVLMFTFVLKKTRINSFAFKSSTLSNKFP